MVSRLNSLWAAALILTCVSGTASALEVTVRAPDTVADDLRIGSLAATLVDNAEGDEPIRPIDALGAAQADYSRLIGVLYELGYFAPTISILVDGREAASISPIAAPSAISNIVIDVRPGDIFTFGTVSITPQAPTSAPIEGLETGQTARVSTLRAGTAAQIAGWRQAGHAKADIESQQITARHAEKTVSAAITLDPGPQLRFGKLTITGESKVREKRIREIMGWPEGKVFDPDDIDKVQTRLRRTGAFAAANLTEAETANSDGTLDMTATVSDQLQRRYSFGAEYSTIDGFGVNALWLHRNIFGGAERLQIDGEIKGVGSNGGDGIDYRFGARLSRPATWRTDLEAYLLTELAQRDDPSLFSRTFRLEFGATYFASDTREYSYGLGLRTSTTRDDLGERDYTILTGLFSAIFDKRDNPLDATSGYYAKVGLTPFYGVSGTDSGLVSTLDLRTYRQIGSRVTLAFRGVVGSVAGPDLNRAPADFLFFSGGSDTVRGQQFQSLGVDLSPGVTVGGRSYLGLSGEVRVKTGENLSVVAFYDAGYVGPEAFFDGSGEWQTGYGAGVRYSTPIGPIRLDVAVPGSGPGDNSGFELYIGIGQAF